MKKINIITTLIVGLALLIGSCQKVETDPTMNINQSAAAAITSPENGSAHVLLLADSAVPFVVNWSAATYSVSGGAALPMPTYSLQMGFADSNFSTIKELYNTQDITFATNVYDFNTTILLFGVEGDSTASIQMRVVSGISEAPYTNDTSEVITMAVTPFNPPTPPPPPGESLYLIGDATDVGWDNTNISLAFTYNVELDVYEIVANLSGTGFLKAFEVEGQWAPQWGTDDAGTSETGILVYRPTEDEPDPVAIPSPEAGTYKITFDLTNLIYTIEPFEQSMHIIGDATDAGWDNTIAIPMTAVGIGKFELVTNLSADASEGFKFLVDQGAWAPMYGTEEGAAIESGVLIYRETEDDPDPKSLPPPSVTGSYLIEMDINTMTYTVTQQ
ncbi:MAG: SusE domain-containing protein [Bacteroidota bacterium]